MRAAVEIGWLGMGSKRDQFVLTRRLRLVLAAALVLALSGFLTIGLSSRAEALPSFARQTGQPCGACHTDFAGLTPYGRRFKIGGYTYGGGPYRTTLFPSSDDSTDSKEKKWVPPISMMAIVGFTNTEAPQPPPTDPYKHQQQSGGFAVELLLGRRHHRPHRRVRATDRRRTADHRFDR